MRGFKVNFLVPLGGLETKILSFNQRVGVEMCLTSILSRDREELRKLSSGALSRSLLHEQKKVNDLSAMASNRIIDNLAGNLKLKDVIDTLEGKNKSLEMRGKADGDVIAALQKDLEDAEKKLDESRETLHKSVEDRSEVEARAIAKFKESKEYGFKLAFHALDFEVKGFAESKRQVLEITPSFPVDRFSAPKTDKVITDSPLITDLDP
ncbi:uncharacterized protein LOC143862450 [Tasmannia lanceolata]|uniref:uncharacterized protein LOC143862450 n=1 Tax=Tasmannia lanceolata TaxID=3420 RepID=UPI00406462B8